MRSIGLDHSEREFERRRVIVSTRGGLLDSHLSPVQEAIPDIGRVPPQSATAGAPGARPSSDFEVVDEHMYLGGAFL